MRYLSLFFFGMFLFLFRVFFTPFMALAQDGGMSTPDFLMYLLSSLGGLKGASVMAIAALVVQLGIKFLGSELCGQLFKNFTGFGKLIVISLLTWISAILGLMTIEHMGFLPAFMHATALNAMMVWVNQLIQHYQEIKNPPAQVK